MFKDRNDAGTQLAQALENYRNKDPLVLAIPRGGVAVAAPVAKSLEAELALLISRKLPLPHNPEAGFGAVAEDGSISLIDDAFEIMPVYDIKKIVKAQKRVIKKRIRALRNGKPLPAFKGRTLILVDDGLAMGSTMRAAVLMCRNYDPCEIIVAVPVAGQKVKQSLEQEVDALIVLKTPLLFRAVAQVYEEWHDMSDEEVLSVLDSMKN
jgi:putative phosphoribosyl transferase